MVAFLFVVNASLKKSALTCLVTPLAALAFLATRLPALTPLAARSALVGCEGGSRVSSTSSAASMISAPSSSSLVGHWTTSKKESPSWRAADLMPEVFWLEEDGMLMFELVCRKVEERRQGEGMRRQTFFFSFFNALQGCGTRQAAAR